jgi:tetratricopeptide (TPR) repeat protein
VNPLGSRSCIRCGEAVSLEEEAMRRAIRSSAHEAAAGHAAAARAALEAVEVGLERDRHELGLLLTEAGALVSSRGFGAAAVRPPLERALELARKLNEAPQLAATLAFLSAHCMQRGEHARTRGLAEEFVALSEQQGDRRTRTTALFILSAALLWCGEYEASVERSGEAIALHRPTDFEFLGEGGLDAGITARGVHALGLWVLGRSEAALRAAECGVEMARKRLPAPHDSTTGWALVFKLQLDLHRRAPEVAIETARELVELAEGQELKRLRAWGTSLGACGRIEAGDVEAGLRDLERSLAGYDDIEAGFWRSYCHGPMAQGYAALGRTDEALVLLRRSQRHVKRTGERFCEGELHRIEAEMLHLRNPADPEEAEASYRRALDVARETGGLAWELRALAGLTRLRAARGPVGELREELRAVCQRFEPSAGNVDLQQALELLASV